MTFDDAGFDVRLRNSIFRNNWECEHRGWEHPKTVEELALLSEAEVMRFPGLGRKSLGHLKGRLIALGFQLGVGKISQDAIYWHGG